MFSKLKLILIGLALVLLSTLTTPCKANTKEIQCLTLTLYKEARGESLAGKAAVAQVIINRKNHPSFPGTICKVIKQKNQFSWYKGNLKPFQKLLNADLRGLNQKDKEAYQEAKLVAQKAFYGIPEYNPKLKDSLYFVHKNSSGKKWLTKLRFIGKVGSHRFYGNKGK